MKTKKATPLVDSSVIWMVKYLNELIVLEKDGMKLYHQLAKKSYAPELKKCLSPAETSAVAHVERIKMILKLFKAKTLTQSTATSPAPALRSASPLQDLDIIVFALKRQHQKMAIYTCLHAVAISKDLEMHANLLEQTILEDRNTSTWLTQLASNVVVPKID